MRIKDRKVWFMKICFVVLHYKTLDDTINCINDIIVLNCEKEIVVVDNGSNDGTYDKLQSQYGGCNIRIIKSDENKGFARGNNIGIKAIKEKNNTLIVVCNSDLRFKQKEFGEILERDYLTHSFAVWAPDITSEDGVVHENPSINEIYDGNSLDREIHRFRIISELCKKRLFVAARIANRTVLSKSKRLEWEKEISTDSAPIKVHGACFALSPQFFAVYDGLFEGTFLFEEENILSDMCLRKGLRIWYDPAAKVVHLGSKSYRETIPDRNERFTNYITECMKSLENYSKWIVQQEE